MPVWGRGVLTLPVSKKCKNEKKRRKEEIEKERDKERELHRQNVWSKLPLRFTNGGRELRTFRTHTSLFGGRGPCRCLEGSGAFRRRHSKRANNTTPTRHLSVLPKAFNIDFTWALPLSFPMFLEAQVRRATVTSSRRRAGVFNEGCAASLEKKYHGPAIASRREAVTPFVTELEEELACQFETRSLTWRWATRGTASKNEC